MSNGKAIDVIEGEAAQILAAADLVVTNSHLVYKAGTHGDAYIDKEGLVRLGISGMNTLLRMAAEKALAEGLEFFYEGQIGVLGPAYGAIALAPPLALHLERLSFRATGKFFPARTELEVDPTGKRIHVIPEKLRDYYAGKLFVIIEDIVNNGTTIREVKTVLESIGAKVIAAICLAERGGQTAGSLGVRAFYPLLRVRMPQYPATECPLCAGGTPINQKLGKGARWVKLFGNPPYPPETDFSAFWK